MDLENGDAPNVSNSTGNSNSSDSTPNFTMQPDIGPTSFQQLQDIQTNLAISIQTGRLAEFINLTVLIAEITKAEPPREDPTHGVRANKRDWRTTTGRKWNSQSDYIF